MWSISVWDGSLPARVAAVGRDLLGANSFRQRLLASGHLETLVRERADSLVTAFRAGACPRREFTGWLR